MASDACLGIARPPAPATPPAKRRRFRGRGAKKRLWKRTRWQSLLEEEEMSNVRQKRVRFPLGPCEVAVQTDPEFHDFHDFLAWPVVEYSLNADAPPFWPASFGGLGRHEEHERREQHELEHVYEDLDWKSPAGAEQRELEHERRQQHELNHERRKQLELELSEQPKVPASTARWRRVVLKALRLERGWGRVAALKEAFSEWVWLLEVVRAGSGGEDAIVGYDTRVVREDTVEDERYTFANEFNKASLAKQRGLARRSRLLGRAFVCGECIGDVETQPGCCDSEPENSSPKKKKKKKQGRQKLKRERKRDTAGPEKSEGIQEENITPLTAAA